MRKLGLFLSLLWAISVPAQIRKAVRKVQVELVGDFLVAGQYHVDILEGGHTVQEKLPNGKLWLRTVGEEHWSLTCDTGAATLPHFTDGAYDPVKGIVILETNLPGKAPSMVPLVCRVHSIHQWWRPESPQHGAPAG